MPRLITSHHTLLSLLVLLTACGVSDPPEWVNKQRAPTSAVVADMATASDASLPMVDMAMLPDMSAPQPDCVAPFGLPTRPSTIEEAIALINSLPKPVTAPCFLESLERPLYITATYSVTSAQPAQGSRSPRVFIFSNELIMSVVMDGDSGLLLEFGQLIKDTPDSIKGEIVFPVEEPLPFSEPYTHVMFREGLTGCALCHRNEHEVGVVDGATQYASVALRPNDFDEVSVEEMREEYRACDAETEPYRCAMYTSLFAWGDVFLRRFPEEMPTIFD